MALGDIVHAVVVDDVSSDFTLPFTPAVGNTLVCQLGERTQSASWALDGFTAVTGTIIPPVDGHQAFRTSFWRRVVQPGDGAAITTTNAGGAASELRLLVWEIEGVLVESSYTPYSRGDQGCSSPWVNTLDPVTAPSDEILVLGGIVTRNDLLATTFTTDAPAVETHDGGAGGRTSMSGAALRVSGASGTYDITINSASGGCQRGFIGALIAFDVAGPPATPDPGTDIDVFDPDMVFLDSIDDAKRKTIRIELQGTGQGTVAIRRDSAHADEDIIKRGNWVRVTISQIWEFAIFQFRIETIETIVIDKDESGGEEIVFGGRGALVYWNNYVQWNESFVVPAGKNTTGGILHGPASTGNEVGQLLARMLAEAQHTDRGVGDFGRRIQPVPLFEYDFDYDVDSDGNAWTVTSSTAELAGGQVGDSGLKSVMNLIGTGAIDIVIKPWETDEAIALRAYNQYGRDLTGSDFGVDVVRFARGVNIADRLKSSQGTDIDPTVLLVQGQENVYAYAETPAIDNDPDVEAFLQTFGTNAAALEAIGVAEMARLLRIGQSVAFRATVPKSGDTAVPDNGLYLPGPEGSNGQYWIGDFVSLDTGTGYGDFDDVSIRVMAITITANEVDDLVVIPELQGTLITGRLRPTIGSVGGGSSAAAGGTSTGGSAPSAPPGGALADAHVTDPSDAHNASAVSFDSTGLSHTDADDVQEAIEDLDAEIGSSSSAGGFDTTPPLSIPLPPWVKPSGSGVITADPQGRITVDSNTEYKAFPGMTFLEGVLHAVWREGTAHNSDTGLLKYKRSYDLGRTWTSATTLITPAGDLDVRDPNIVALSSGRLLVTYDLREYDTSPDEIFAWRIYSDNRGQSWSSPAQITMSFSGQQIVSGQAVEMPSGEILLPVFGDNGSFYIAACLFSTDDGDTFGDEATIATGTHDWEEPVVRHLSTGNTVALLRDSLGTVTYRAVSTDGGHTWGAKTSVLTASGRPDFVEFYPKALFLSARGASPDFAARWWISWDEGATWSSAQEVDTGETDEQEYSAPVVLAAGYVGLLYSIEDGSDAHIYFRLYRDGFGTDPLGNADLAGLTVDGIPFDLSDPDDGEVLTYDSGSSSLLLAPSTGGATLDEVAAAGFVGAILIDDTHSTPLVFGDLLQNDDQDDLLYADVPLP